MVFNFAFFFSAGTLFLRIKYYPQNSAKIKPREIKVLHRNSWVCDTNWCKRKPKKKKKLTCHQIRLKRRESMKRNQHVQCFLSVWHKRLLSATHA